MKPGRIRAVIVLVVVLSLGGTAGWLMDAASDPGAATERREELATVTRAIGSVSSLVTVIDPELAAAPAFVSATARTAQSDVVSAIGAVSARTESPAWSDLDALLISTLDGIQRIDSDRAAVALAHDQLGVLVDEIQRSVGSILAEDRPPGGRSPWMSYLLAGVLLALGVVAIAIANRSRTVEASPPRGSNELVTGPGNAETRGPVQELPVDTAAPPSAGLPDDTLDAPGFARLLERERARCERYHHDLSVVELTVDQAADIAEQHGESGLEDVVGSIAELVIGNTRSSDSVALLSDHRVVVLAAETSADHAEQLARKLRRSIEVFPFSDDIQATVSTRSFSMTDGEEHLRIE